MSSSVLGGGGKGVKGEGLGPALPGDRSLSVSQVSCVGQLVCAVIAESEVQAKRAAERVKVVYEDLQPLILTIEVTSTDGSVKMLLVTVTGEKLGPQVASHTEGLCWP